MRMAYFNYPEDRVSIHGRAACPEIRKRRKEGQRIVEIDVHTIARELANFRGREYRFSATSKSNDMWVKVSFGDSEFEEAVIRYVHRLLGKRYQPFRRARIATHCP